MKRVYDDEASWFAAVPENYHPRPEFAFASRDPALPDVLLLGDSISMSYTPAVRTLLAGRANLYRAPDNCRSTRQLLAELSTYLGELGWRVIHCNAGIHDFTWKGSDGKACEVGGGAAPPCAVQVPIDEYRSNLETLFRRLLATGAAVIWASTTPVQPGTFARDPTDAIAYNAAALEAATRKGIAVNDLHAACVPRLLELQPPQNVHFNDAGARYLGGLVAEAIGTRL